MATFTRRRILQALGGAFALGATPSLLQAQIGRPHVVVVGGGFAGATAAKYLRDWSGGSIDVTLVEANATHVSCILSNLVVNRRVTLPAITFSYDRLSQKFGVKVRRARARAIDPVARTVRLSDGTTLSYDRLVLAPGIEFDPVPGLDMNRVPHAWRAGPQTLLLRNQLEAMPAGGVFAMSIPQAPYRCPPGPYERACVIADYVRRKKPGSKVIVLDANPGITAEKETFTRAFTETYKGIIDYRPNVVVSQVDSVGRTLITNDGNLQASVLNVIPRQHAPSLLVQTGLVNDPSGRWAGVDPLSYESTAHPNVHIIGDAQATGQPKAGHIANAEAKVCADAIIRSFSGLAPDPAPVTNSACFSPITLDSASWLTVVFQYDPATRAMKSVPASFGEAGKWSRDNYSKMFDWADNLFVDTFG